MKSYHQTKTPNLSASHSTSKLFLRELLLSAVVIISPLIYPATVHAGLFSAFTQIFGDSASAKTKDDVNVLNLQNMSLLQAAVNQDPNPNRTEQSSVIVSGNALIAEISPQATVTDVDDETNTQISTYTVRPGDTLSKIADMFDVSVNTIIWANDLGSSPTLVRGRTLVILPISGVRHIVKKGETLSSVAAKYKSDLNEIIQYNDLAIGSTIKEGDILIIPDGEISTVTPQTVKKGTSVKINPIHGANGPSYPGYYLKPVDGYRSQGLHGYNGVDIAAPSGTPIYASADGVVIVSVTGGWNGGYGNYIVISHPNGTQTLYSHAKETLVIPGQQVTRGQLIGKVGATGKASGPHIHFEVRGAQNPFK
jgi:murein DD-endopeptidase MepM/ murein hydrolase activator NlpD